MKTIRQSVSLLLTTILAITAVSCGVRINGEQEEVDLSSPQQLCGGYTEQRELTVEEMEMFRYVTGTGDITFTPLSVSTQVVAGTNYRFWCRVDDRNSAEDNPGYCWITIFKPLTGQGEPRLISIEKE